MDAPPIRYARTADGVKIAYQVFGEGLSLLVCPGPFSQIARDWGFADFHDERVEEPVRLFTLG